MDRVAEGEEGNVAQILTLKSTLGDIERGQCMGAIIRSKAQYVVEGERSTKFFFGLEKTRQRANCIKEVLLSSGERVKEQQAIFRGLSAFYEDLFKKQGIQREELDKLLGLITAQLTEVEVRACDKDITVEEIEQAINGVKACKSPGSDGLPGEFYKAFKSILIPVLLEVFMEIEDKGGLSPSMSRGVLTLIYKKKGDPADLRNFRPLSLLNSDYKLLTRILANRMKDVLPSIIAPTQAYGVPGRDIAETVCAIRDVVGYMADEGEGGDCPQPGSGKGF